MTSAARRSKASATKVARQNAICFTRKLVVDLSFQDRQSPLRRSARRGNRRRRTEVEIHRWRFLRSLLRGEERLLLKAKHAAHHIGRETSQRRVVVLHRGVEVIALDRNSVLGAFELRL